MYSIRYVRVGRLRYGAVHTSWNPPWFAGITLFILRRKDMLYNKRPLIYIPKKKKIVGSAPAPTPVTSSVSSRVYTNYLKYPTGNAPSENWQWPQSICFNPKINQFTMQGKQTGLFRSDSNYTTMYIPIVEDSSRIMTNVASGMRWCPLPYYGMTSAPMVSIPYAFFIGNQPTGEILRIIDSSSYNPQRLGSVIMSGEVIPGTSNPQLYLSKINDVDGIVAKIRNKLISKGISTIGTLIFSDQNNTVWTDATLLSFNTYFARNLYGNKNTVTDFDLNA